MSYIDSSRVKAIDILKDCYNYLVKTYEASDAVLVPSSPSGQLLDVVASISEHIFLYLEHAAAELNMQTAQTRAGIQGLAMLTGHDPWRGSSASGQVALKTNPSKIENGDCVKIMNYTEFAIDENGMLYYLNLGQDYIVLRNGEEPVNVEFVQGLRSSSSFTASGDKLQTYNVNEKGMTDHTRVRVFVNGEEWTQVASLWDMTMDGHQFMCRTSANMGLGIYFGNGDFGKIPEAGNSITVEYVLHNGAGGNLSGGNFGYKFSTGGFDINGEDLDLNEVLSATTIVPPSMGSDYEPLELTRLLAPKTSKNFVLATPESYISYLSKFSQFAFVNAYNTKDDGYLDDDNVVYLQILPNIKAKASGSGGYDYFTLPEEEYVLTDEEKNGIIHCLDDSGQQLISTEIVINDYDIRRYALVITLRWFQKADKSAIRAKIREKLNTYFLNINRTDFIPKSDLIALIEGIDGVDGVNVYFISEENEQAIRNGYYIKKYDQINPNTHLHETYTKKIMLKEGEDPQIGLDSFGDIKLEDNTIAIIRGGWTDRYGNEYKSEITDTDLCGLTILFTKETEDSLYNTMQQKKLNKLLGV